MLKTHYITAKEALKQTMDAKEERAYVLLQVVYNIKPNLVTHIFNKIGNASKLGANNTTILLGIKYSTYVLDNLQLALELLGYTVYYTKCKKQVTIKWNN